MKNIFLLFSLLSSFTHAQLPSNIPTDGLIGYWPLDGNANDVSGNENNGTVYGASVTSDRFGNPNKAYSFSVNESGGWGAAQHRIVVSNPTIPNNNSFTMSAWVNLETKPSPFNNRSHSIMGRWDGNGDRVFRYQIKYSGEVYTQLYSEGNNYSHTSGNVPYSNWAHIVSTYDGFTLKHYVDGVLTGQENLGLTMSSSTTNLTFGEIHMANGHWYLFSGEMDDLGYWSRALTENEVVNIYDTNQCSEVSVSASATEVCEGGSVDLEAIIAPSMNSNPAWELLIDESEYDSNRINLSETAYDRVNNNIFSVHKTGSELTFYKFDLNNNSVNNISTSFIPPNVGPFTFDTNNNMIVAGRVGRDDLYGVSPSGGSWISYGSGSFDSESYGSQYYWNSFNQKVGFFGGYGFYTVKNWIWENGGSWTNVFSNNNNCSSNIPAKRNTKFALGAPNSNELYFISGQGSCSGDQFASSCNLGDAWATDVGVYCWLKDLWKLDLDTYTFTNILALNNSSITQEGNFVYDYLDNSFYIVGGFVPSPTYNPNYGNITNFSNTVLKFSPDYESGFSEFNVEGNGPPVISLNNIGPNKAYFDPSNNQIVWIRKDGVWGIPLNSNNNLTTYLWSTGDTTANISVTPLQTTEYWVDVTTNGVTCREYITIDVTAPAAPTGDSQQTFCEALTVADLSATGDNIQWYDAATGGNLLDTTSALTDGQTVYASQTVNGCESTDRLEVTVSIQDITITASATEVCAGESVDLSIQDHPQTIGTVQIFVDGVLVSSETDLNFNNLDHNAPMFFGVENPYISLPSGPQYLNGTLDDIAIWNRPLSPSDVISLYNNPSVCSISDLSSNLINGLVGYWPFCGDANDIGEFNLNGVNNGGTLQTDRFGNSGRAYFLGSNNWIEVNHNNVLNVSQSSYTLSAWVKKETTGPSQFNHFITKTAVTPSPSYSTKGFCLRYENSTAAFFETQHPPGQNFIPNFSVNSSQVDMSQWHLITGVYYGSINNNENSIIWSTGDTTANISVAPTDTTEYWVDVTTNGVTCREYVTINVTAPAAPTGNAEQTFCDVATIADLTATGENIQWYDSATGGNLLNSTTALTDGQMVYASQTVNGCESTERLEVSVSIQDITITASATEVCTGESVDLSVISCTSADLPANLQTGLVGYWPFCGNANDESGNGNSGTVNGATLTTDRFGNQDSAYIFEINDSFINIGSDNLLQFSNDFSYSVKFLVNEITLGSDCTAGSNIILNNEGLYEIGVDCNGILSFAIANDDPSWSWIPITPILINQWYDVTFTYNQGVIEIFMDGDLIYNYNGSGGLTDFHPNLNDLRLGDRQLHDVLNVQTSSFNGKIDDVVLWNRALTEAEVQQLAGAPSYTWSTGDTTANIAVTPTETTEYWVDVTNNGVTCREYVTINVTAPATPTGPLTQSFCDTATIADLTATGDNIQWYDAATVGNLLDSTTALTDGQMVYASQTVNGCESNDRLEVTVSIQDITLTASATEVCAGETITITAQSLGLLLDNKFCSKNEIPITLHDSLLGAWPFCGNPNDVSGNNFNGTINGGVSLGESRFGDLNDSYIFDGQPLTYISMGTHESLDITQGSISISCWVDVNNVGGTKTILSKANNDTTNLFGSYNLHINGDTNFVVTNSTNTNGFYSLTNGSPTYGGWLNIIAVADINDLKLRLYLDGLLVSEIDWEGTYKGGLQEFLIGSHYKSNFGLQYMYNFNGSIDDVAIWNRVLNQYEVDYLSMTNSSTYSWSTGDTTENITVTPTETTEYWVDVTTNGVTCREYITIDVTSPAAPTGNPVQGGCSDFTVGSNNNAFTGENLQWYATPSGGNALPDSHLLVDGAYYYISQTVDGCESSDRFEFLYLAPEPTITIESPTICEGDSTTVSVSSSPSLGTATFLWNTGETSESITLSPTESTTFWVDQIYNSGGPENIQTVCRYFFGITVDNAPEAPVSGGDITECETITAQSLTAIALANSGESITWYDAATGGSIVADPSLSAAGTVTYYAEATNDTSGCASLTRTAVTLTITSVAAPTGDAVQSFCDNVTVSDLSASGSNIQWYDAAIGGNLLDPSSALSDGQFLYASQTENGCESITRLEVSVEIDIIPDPILVTTELEFCLARETTLADLEVDEQGFALEWYDSFSGSNMLPMDTLLEDGVSYYATLYDAVSGCESLMRLEVVPTVIPCEVIIYNAISLNDNGMNDYMVIENAEYFPDNSLEVYNRDGHLLYSQTQYGIGGNLFRGKANVSGVYNKNSNLPTGSYLYVFKYFNPYEQQEYTLKGFLTINSN